MLRGRFRTHPMVVQVRWTKPPQDSMRAIAPSTDRRILSRVPSSFLIFHSPTKGSTVDHNASNYSIRLPINHSCVSRLPISSRYMPEPTLVKSSAFPTMPHLWLNFCRCSGSSLRLVINGMWIGTSPSFNRGALYACGILGPQIIHPLRRVKGTQAILVRP